VKKITKPHRICSLLFFLFYFLTLVGCGLVQFVPFVCWPLKLCLVFCCFLFLHGWDGALMWPTLRRWGSVQGYRGQNHSQTHGGTTLLQPASKTVKGISKHFSFPDWKCWLCSILSLKSLYYEKHMHSRCRISMVVHYTMPLSAVLYVWASFNKASYFKLMVAKISAAFPVPNRVSVYQHVCVLMCCHVILFSVCKKLLGFPLYPLSGIPLEGFYWLMKCFQSHSVERLFLCSQISFGPWIVWTPLKSIIWRCFHQKL